ncbi:MAG: hypothetical protein WKG03_13355 [Telluria sp.]
MQHYAIWYGDTKALAKALRRSERSVEDWLAGRTKVPWWVPEIMRMQQAEHAAMIYQMTSRRMGARLGVVAGGTVIDAGSRFLAPLFPDAAPDTPRAVFDEAVKTAQS